MLSIQTLSNIEALLLSKSDSRWGEFMVLAQTIGEVQAEKNSLAQAQQARVAMEQLRVQEQLNAQSAGLQPALNTAQGMAGV